MTHFIGAVLVPASVEKITNTSPTKYPTLYGTNAKEWTAGTALNEFLEEALERFSENREVNIWQPKADLIAKARKDIEDYRDGTYAEYLKDPVKYAEGVSNGNHLKYLREEFPLKLEWSDEDIYQKEVLKWEEPESIRESDGAIHTSYNPESKWDWWTIGGRWEQQYRERQGEKISVLRDELKAALVNLDDPEAQAELAAVEEEIARVREAFRSKTAGLTWEDMDKAEAKRLDCRAYLPWWFPHSLVTKESDLTEDETTNQLTGYEWNTAGRMGWWGMKSDDMTQREWVEKLIEILEGRDENDYLIYIDFHI